MACAVVREVGGTWWSSALCSALCWYQGCSAVTPEVPEALQFVCLFVLQSVLPLTPVPPPCLDYYSFV